MTSQIVSNTLDSDFPVAGIDNDSQGFRDNFSVIKIALETAASEISVLQSTTAKLGTEETNDFLGGIVTNVQLRNSFHTTTVVPANTIDVGGGISITGNAGEDPGGGDYFKIIKDSNTPIAINWPENPNGNYIKIRLEITAVGSRIISFEDPDETVKSNFINTPGVAGIALAEGEIGIFDCWIAGESATVFIQHIETFA